MTTLKTTGWIYFVASQVSYIANRYYPTGDGGEGKHLFLFLICLSALAFLLDMHAKAVTEK